MTDPAPYFDRHVFFCTNERAPGHPRGCCKEKGSEALRDHMKAAAKEAGLGKRVRVNAAGCLDRCELGPTLVIYPEGVWYTCATPGDVDEIVKTHLVEGGRVDRLMLYPDEKVPAHRARKAAAAD
ncbi:(2Fe-2S) ferredoxin domain-containing protein [Nitrospirillum viridazoti]|uniref:Ferredoxin n=1 Tax=Nitrospirillum viridazoti CBAmc TaxID=1441467 RepID=A0A248JLK7_9PROT|nr:(2Fe-2S) ferredoxin domain-containing protein [Nitrospirillum amazonense]ASG19426.1 ferredoxin [Nitrospirillum amazonense CBAmc]TWB42066.1 (2Fe-2S) ferredoxin [Nitrospirillum amazonense]